MVRRMVAAIPGVVLVVSVAAAIIGTWHPLRALLAYQNVSVVMSAQHDARLFLMRDTAGSAVRVRRPYASAWMRFDETRDMFAIAGPRPTANSYLNYLGDDAPDPAETPLHGWGFHLATGFAPLGNSSTQTQHVTVIVPKWFWPSAAGLIVLLQAIRAVRRRRTRRQGHCRFCGYDLRASPVRCPECGNVAAAIRPRRGMRMRRHPVAVLVCTVLAVIVLHRILGLSKLVYEAHAFPGAAERAMEVKR